MHCTHRLAINLRPIKTETDASRGSIKRAQRHKQAKMLQALVPRHKRVKTTGTNRKHEINNKIIVQYTPKPYSNY